MHLLHLPLTILAALSAFATASPAQPQGVQALAEQPFRPVRGDAGPTPELHGVWLARGYGWLAEITPTGGRVFDHGPAGTLEQPGDPGELLEGTQYRALGDVMQLTGIPGSSSVYTWDRLVELPAGCSTPPGDDPVACFDYFFGVMEAHYAYFDVRGIDWAARGEEHRPRVGPQTSEGELWEVFCDMLRGFGDDHMSLTGTVEGEERQFDDGYCRELDPALDTGFAGQDVLPDRDAYQRWWAREQKRQMRQELLQGEFRTGAQEQVVWGRIGPIGYLNIRGMGGFSESEDPRDEVLGVHALLSEVIAELADCEGLVLDITTNSGGYDEVQMAIASHFVDERRPAFRKLPLDVHGPRSVAPQTFELFPADGPRFLRPVCLVTSDFSVSAAEDFTLGMRELPHVTHVGARTRGAFSDILEKRLPNGWVLALSNEAYLDVEGRNYEGHGVPPEHEVPIFVAGSVETSHLDAIYAIVDAMLAGEYE